MTRFEKEECFVRLGTTEMILILILALVIFGGGKIAGIGKALGQSIREFKSEIRDAKDAVQDEPKNGAA